MNVTNDVIGIAGYSMIRRTLEVLKEREIISDDDLREIFKRAIHPNVGSEGGPALNAEAGKLVGDLSRTMLKPRES